MKVYDAPNIRNVAIVGHGGCGKTSLVSGPALRRGRGRTGWGGWTTGRPSPTSTPTRSSARSACRPPSPSPSGRRRRSTCSTPRATRTSCPRPGPRCGWPTPPLVVVDAVAGVEVQTEKVWGYAEEYGLARLIVVNRMDRENASFERALESIQAAFGRAAVPIAIPLGEEKDFRGRRRPRLREGPRLRRRRERQVRGGGHPGGPAGGREGLAREARRDGGREQRGADGGVLREGHAPPGASSPRACARRWRRGRSSRCSRPPPLLNVGRPRRSSTRSWTCCPRPPTAARRSGTRPGAKDEVGARAGRRRAAVGLRLQDASSTRTPGASASSASTPGP